jgi:hypothetical protein
MTEFFVEYKSTIGLMIAGLIVISFLYIGLHTDLVEDVSERNKRNRKVD